ncbi:manganese efflux pump [Psychrobacillus sp. NEAU-3TGS]|uniref:manganese efflux pump n=1 Tax=Psychrobacillus sp. NEAU-3TGS TaxID=2995412 RepID=UPI00249830D4|nr:manganese efflux pump [Psychrobacillus sp. NEAU-3TGS]MDI2587760.1 manganese efflux pump [Psychrobacillus sp. NEAU-3TGS]
MWREIVAGGLMSVDVLILFSLVLYRKQIFTLAAWVASLHMLFPLIGYYAGAIVQNYLKFASPYLSSFLLILVGLQMILARSPKQVPLLSPYLLAVVASIDTFSVSISFGMLEVEKFLFILSSGIFSYLAVFIAQKVIFKHAFLNRGLIMKLAGVGILILGVIILRNI